MTSDLWVKGRDRWFFLAISWLNLANEPFRIFHRRKKYKNPFDLNPENALRVRNKSIFRTAFQFKGLDREIIIGAKGE
ncbi:MAG: hypothetical protein Q7T48_09110, partial [Cellvibrio sp.]|uniref:hypothetical protein n=1 Tax=Cellvibrio sp. TaxID=1965322 RepID=UPI00272376A2|nr:hypothetical protein [Cellvibrio sp.]